jgi:hypothetical protein
MIRITQQNSAKDAKRYYATADYYSEGQELVGSWGGKGASRLGLAGTVDKFSFERLCGNLDPTSGLPLTAILFGLNRGGRTEIPERPDIRQGRVTGDGLVPGDHLSAIGSHPARNATP